MGDPRHQESNKISDFIGQILELFQKDQSEVYMSKVQFAQY